MTIGALPWRVGSKVPRNVYDADGVGIAMMPTEEIARAIVDAVNSRAERAPAECERPPFGWRCSRKPGHSGPCAARPVT